MIENLMKLQNFRSEVLNKDL